MIAEEVEDWDALVKSAGFRKLKAWVQEEYGTQLLEQIRGVLDDHNGDVALSKMRQIQTARAAALRIIGYPEKVVADAKAAASKAGLPANLSRGGL